MASGDQLAWFDAESGSPPSANAATLDNFAGAANHIIPVLDFDTGTPESRDFMFVMPSHYTPSALFDVDIVWRGLTAGGTDGVVWQILFKPITPGVDNPATVAYGTAQTFAESDPAATSGEYVKVSLNGITFAAAGSPLVEENIYIRITRATADSNDTLTEDGQFVSVEIKEAA